MSFKKLTDSKIRYLIIACILMSPGVVYRLLPARPDKEHIPSAADKAGKEAQLAMLAVESDCGSTRPDGRPDNPRKCDESKAVFAAAETKFEELESYQR
jgi:hypothetical protein